MAGVCSISQKPHDPFMIRKLIRILLYVFAALFLLSVFMVLLYRYMPVRYTPLMAIRASEYRKNKEKVVRHHHWVPLEQISVHLIHAVVAAEDQRFFEHRGFDVEEIKRHAGRTLRAAVPEEPVPFRSKRQKRISVASPLLGTERTGSVFYFSDRTLLEQRADSGGIPELHRNGKRHLRGRGRCTAAFPPAGLAAHPGASRPDCRHAAQSPAFQLCKPLCLYPSPPGRNLAANGPDGPACYRKRPLSIRVISDPLGC